VVVLVAKTLDLYLYTKLNVTNVQKKIKSRRFVYRTGRMTWCLALSFAATTCVLSAWKTKNYAGSCPSALGGIITCIMVASISRTRTSDGNATLPYATLWQMYALLFASHASNIILSNAGVTRLGTATRAACIAAAPNEKKCDCDSCGENGTIYGSQDEIEEIDDDASVAGNVGEHPWQGIDFDDDLMKGFKG
jgi:hypothetical protein